ncbi:uncharacterized protein BJ171DRAFT_591347 [Polychytrium aggregatum]|uniref:uncharacterized protein n=1 Tax=Polychytrium aggregatum TaxID=110093 RepID=UPI0022FF3FFE|nr:uncharacterized protein BJ171DRAFT_591347 [Polychytrium aggregatum]KAI9190676.1 hypothetical protein BJ171DRAFT_591347 [Polychytrium aggregatum]
MPFDDSNASAIILILLIDGGYLGIRDFVVLSRVNQATHHYLNPSNQVWWPEVYRSVVKLPKYTIADGDHYSVLRAIGSFIHRRSDIPAPFEARLWEYALYPMSPLLDAVRAMVDRPTLKAMMERTHRLLVINRIVSRAAPEDQDIDISARNTSAGSACLHFFNRGVYKINMLEFTPESIDVAFFISKELIWTEFLVYHQRDTTEFAASPVYLAMVVSMVKSLAPRAHIRLPADIATRIPGAVCFEGASQIEYYGSMSRFEPTKLPTTPNVEVLTLSNFVFMMSTQYAFVGTSLRHISIGQSSTILTFGVFQTVAATLDSLSFSDCNIPYGFHDFPIHWPALTSLTINWCDVPDLQGLPKSLPAIQCFMFTSVREIKSFRGMPQEMPRLETLVVSPRCANSPASLRHFPPRLPMLRELKLDGFNNLISLRGFPHAHQLEFLSMSGTSIVSFDGLSMV